MAILEVNDFFGVDLSADQMQALIVSAQRMAESALGAGRPLETTEFSQILPVAKVMQTAQLSYWPIADTPTPVIEIRQATTTIYGRSQGTSDWYTLDESQYILDDTGKLHLNRGHAGSGFNRSATFTADEVRATYTSGFDFSVSSYEVEQIKNAVLAIALAQTSQQYQNNVSRITVNDEVTVQYGSTSDTSGGTSPLAILSNPAGLSLKEAMLFLRKYAPRVCP